MSAPGWIDRSFPAGYEVELLERIEPGSDDVRRFAPPEAAPEWPALFPRPVVATIALRFTLHDGRRWIGVFPAPRSDRAAAALLTTMPAVRHACVRVDSLASIVDVGLAQVIDQQYVSAILPLVERRLVLLLGAGDATAYDERGRLWITEQFLTDEMTPRGLVDGRLVLRGDPDLDGDREFAIDLATGFAHGDEYVLRPVFARRDELLD